MRSEKPQPITVDVDEDHRVSGLVQAPPDASACYVLVHSAGAGMRHPFMQAMAEGLAARGIATLRYQFPYMEQKLKRPDRPELAHKTARAAVAKAHQLLPDLPLFAGGKSFGGRMTSQAQAASPMPGVCGLIFLGFPLHPAGKPSGERAEHLFNVQIPMLFLQGARDALADLALLKGVIQKLGTQATLKLFEDADHSFYVPARSGRTDSEVQTELLDTLVRWLSSDSVLAHLEPTQSLRKCDL